MDVAIVKVSCFTTFSVQPMLHFCSFLKWTYQETFKLCFFFFFLAMSLGVTVSASLLLGSIRVLSYRIQMYFSSQAEKNGVHC